MNFRVSRLGKGRWIAPRLMIAVAVVVAFGVYGSTALAASGTSASDQYELGKPITPVVVTKGEVASKPNTKAKTTVTSTPTATSENLPFTGMSLVSVVVIGGALVGVGFVLRRRNQQDGA